MSRLNEIRARLNAADEVPIEECSSCVWNSGPFVVTCDTHVYTDGLTGQIQDDVRFLLNEVDRLSSDLQRRLDALQAEAAALTAEGAVLASLTDKEWENYPATDDEENT